MTSLYGRIVTGGQVRAAVQDTLETWLPAYLAEVQRQHNLTLPPVRHYSTGIDPATPPDDLPGVAINAPGVDGEFVRHGGGRYDAPWGVGIGVVVAHRLQDTACLWAETYTAAIRACIVQHGSLGGLAVETRLNDEEVNPTDWNTEWSVWAGVLYFTSIIPGIVDASGGPSVPPSPDVTVPLQSVEITSAHVTTVPGS